MPEVIVTKTLSDTIKNYRKEIKMRGDTLSKRLRKNTSFISQLETGKLKTIDTDILYEIFDILLENESAVNKNKKLSEILDNIGLTLSEKELEHQNWMHIFDLQYRIIPIPKSIVSFIEKNVKDYSLNTTSIVKEINRNIPLFDSFSKDQIDELEDNRVYCECTSNSTHTYIKFNLPEDYINDIIEKKITRCNFVNMHIIIISILSRTENLDYNTAYDKAEQFLFENKFYTLLQKQRISSTNPDKLAPYDIDFSKNMSNLSSIFNAINDKQPGFLTDETDILKNFVKNLKEEPTITLSIISKNISDLSNMDRENKKSFVKDFSKLIEQYQIKSSDDDHKIETF